VEAPVTRLKELLDGMGAVDPVVMYGGTVNDESIESFAELEVLDGVGATRSSLDPENLLGMLDRIGRVT
jgi:triosephosphate isomerase